MLMKNSHNKMRNYFLGENIIPNWVFTSGSDLLCQTEHARAYAKCVFAQACTCEGGQRAEVWVDIENIQIVGAQSVTQKICCSLRVSLTWPKAVGG